MNFVAKKRYWPVRKIKRLYHKNHDTEKHLLLGESNFRTVFPFARKILFVTKIVTLARTFFITAK